jgi:hypothetical protein
MPGLYRGIRSFVSRLSARECANYFSMPAMLQYDQKPLFVVATGQSRLFHRAAVEREQRWLASVIR